MEVKKIIICGGHLSPALALISELAKNKTYEIYYLGRKYSLEGDKTFSMEYRIIRKMGIKYICVHPARLQRSLTRYTFGSILRFPFSLVSNFIIMYKLKPDIVISFGGYVSLPACLCAILLSIPVIIHEQTAVLGLSNRIISRFAKKVCLSWKGVKYAQSLKNKVLIGNLINQSWVGKQSAKYIFFGDKKLPLIYFTGGSLGSRSINKLVLGFPDKIFSKLRIIHQCGSAMNYADYHQLSSKKDNLPPEIRGNYKIVPFLEPQEVQMIYNRCDLVVGRSGANTVTEIAYFGKPAILIPLPWSAEDEQRQNAQVLEKTGLAIIADQATLTPEILAREILNKIENITLLRDNALAAKKLIPKDAAKTMADLIATNMKHHEEK